MKPRIQSSPQRRRLLQDLAQRLAALERPHPVRVAVDGIDVAGKTTLADELALRVQALGRPVIRASLDGFHHPRAHCHRRGPLSSQGYYEDSFDYDALRASLLRPLSPGGDGRYRAGRRHAPSRRRFFAAAGASPLLGCQHFRSRHLRRSPPAGLTP